MTNALTWGKGIEGKVDISAKVMKQECACLTKQVGWCH